MNGDGKGPEDLGLSVEPGISFSTQLRVWENGHRRISSEIRSVPGVWGFPFFRVSYSLDVL